jgi:murein DD-endopeptidase MepM/ murein hydrolase activator NlpD
MIKKWTVILIPHNRGERRSFTLSDVHVWTLLGVILVLMCVTVFFLRRSQVAIEQQQAVERQYLQLQDQIEEPDLPAEFEKRLGEREVSIRQEYEQRDAVITEELNRLFELEKEVRVITGLPAQKKAIDVDAATLIEGKGGSPGGQEGLVYSDDPSMRPPEIIYGLLNPSADLMIQEMAIRMESIQTLLVDMDDKKERIAHTPSVWPTNETVRRINSKFGMRRDPFTNRMKSHSGVDITANYGTDVLATANGVVSFSGHHQFLGNLIKIDHDYGLESWYGHMSKRLLKKGDAVLRGEVIGKVGSTGRATGAHIHYEIHLNGVRVNPRNYIGQ